MNKMELKHFIGKMNDDIEKELGFTHYIELKDFIRLGKEQDHKKMVAAFFEMVGSQELTIIKTDNGKIVDLFPMPLEDIKSNFLLLENKQGAFWEEETEMCFALLGDKFFSYVFPNSIMFSSGKEDSQRMAGILDKYELKYFGPEDIKENYEQKPRKLGRNEPCHCGSEKKYKKCCLAKDIKRHGRAVKA